MKGGKRPADPGCPCGFITVDGVVASRDMLVQSAANGLAQEGRRRDGVAFGDLTNFAGSIVRHRRSLYRMW
jgi:hypothetical protein